MQERRRHVRDFGRRCNVTSLLWPMRLESEHWIHSQDDSLVLFQSSICCEARNRSQSSIFHHMDGRLHREAQRKGVEDATSVTRQALWSSRCEYQLPIYNLGDFIPSLIPNHLSLPCDERQVTCPTLHPNSKLSSCTGTHPSPAAGHRGDSLLGRFPPPEKYASPKRRCCSKQIPPMPAVLPKSPRETPNFARANPLQMLGLACFA